MLYGGQAGGGKSEFLLMEALRYVHVEGYSAILFRRTFPELKQPRGLIERSRLLYPLLGGVYYEQAHFWRFPAGSMIAFDHLEHEDDKNRYQSAEFAFIGFDELTSFAESQYLYLFSRARTTAIDPRTGIAIPSRVRAASNPGNYGHQWVKDRFIDKCPAFKVKYFIRNEDEEDEEVDADHPDALSRQFIPARLSDNPKLAEVDPGYERRLKALSYVERRQLLYGDWDAVLKGNEIQPIWFEGKVRYNLPTFVKYDAQTREEITYQPQWKRYWDLAASVKEKASWTASVRGAVDLQGNLWFANMVREKKEWPDISKIMKDYILHERGTIENGIEKKLHGLAAHQEMMRDPDLIAKKVTAVDIEGDKIQRSRVWTPRAEAGKVYLVDDRDDPWVPAFLSRCAIFDGTGKSPDDEIDTCSGAVQMLGGKRFRRLGFMHL